MLLNVPKSWKAKNLSSVAKVSIGLVTTMTEHYSDSGVPLIRNSDIKENRITKEKLIKLNPSFAEQYPTRTLNVGDIVTVHTGEVGVSAKIDDELNGCLGFATLNTRPNLDMVDPEYLCWYFNNPRFLAHCVSLSTGDGRQNLNLKDFAKVKVPLPPLPEQKKIAKILSTWDKAITTTEQLFANSLQQKKALMQQLLTGKKRLLDKNGVRFEGEWRKLPFSDLVSLVKTKFDPKANADDVRECIELEHIAQASSSLCGSTNTTVAVSTKTAFEKGDVLFGKLRPYLRKYWKADRQGVCSTEIWVFRTKAKVAANYISQVVQLDSFIEVANKSSGTHMPRADWNVVKDFLISTPPLEEQQKIAAVLSSADQEISALQQKLDALKQEKKALMQQLLTGRRRVKIDNKEVA